MPLTDTAKPTELIVIRHGQTTWNAEGRLQGHIGGELSDLGHRQAVAVAQRIAREHIDAIYCSDLERAMNTAEYIASETRLEVTPDLRLRERAMGIFESHTWQRVRELYPEAYAEFQQHDPDYVIPEGESSRQMHDRVLACCGEIVSRHPGQRVVVVTHGGVLHRLFYHTVGLPMETPRRWSLYNCGIHRFLVTDSHWLIATWGDIEHLAALGTDDD